MQVGIETEMTKGAIMNVYKLTITTYISYQYEVKETKFYLTEPEMQANRMLIESRNRRGGGWIPNITSMDFEEREIAFDVAKEEMTIAQFEELFNIDINYPVKPKITPIEAKCMFLRRGGEAMHKLGELTRDTYNAELIYVQKEDNDYWYGLFAEGFGFYDVRFKKEDCVDATEDMIERWTKDRNTIIFPEDILNASN